MKTRRLFTFESLESRQMLTTAPLDSAQLQDAEELTSDEQQASDGWIRYRDDGTVIFESNGETLELTPAWPAESTSEETRQRVDWQPLKVADFNGDGNEDILGTTSDGDPWLQVRDVEKEDTLVAVLWGDRLLPTHEVLGYGDVNGDARLDVISVDRESRELWVSVNTLTKGFSRQAWGTLPGDENQLFVGDFDGDQQTDLLIGTDSEKWQLAKSDGTSFDIQPWGGFPVLDWQDVLVGNFDANSGLDVAGLAPDNTWWVWSGSDSRMQPANYWGHMKMVTDDWVDLRVEDLNSDGLDDIIGRTDAGELWVSTAKSEGKFHPWRWADGWIESAQWKNVIVADAVGDALPDYVGQASGGTWWVAENLGDRFINSYMGKLDAVSFAAPVASFAQPTEAPTVPEIDEPTPIEPTPVVELPSTGTQLQVMVNEDLQIVLKGNGQLINGITLTSASGSLVWNDAHRGPLDSAVEQTEYKVRLISSDQPVEVNGEVVLGVAWLANGGTFDLQVTYDRVEVAAVITPPPEVVTENPEEPIEEPVEQPTEPTEPTEEKDEQPDLDPNLDPVEDPQEETPDPADADPTEEDPTTDPGEENPVDPVEGNDPTIEEPADNQEPGDEVPDVEVVEDPNDPDIEDPTEPTEPLDPVDGTDDPTTEEQPKDEEPAEDPTTEDPAETPTDDPKLEMTGDMSDLPFSLDEESRLVLAPMDVPVMLLRLTAPGGGLIATESVEPFDEYYAQSERLVLLGSHDGATWSDGETLGVAWNKFVDPHALVIEFVTATRQEWQSLTTATGEAPDVIASEVDPNETPDSPTETPKVLPFGSAGNPLRVSINDDSQLVLSADGISVPAVDFVSPAGGLIPGGSPQPFEFFVTSHKRQITLGTWGDFVTIDGSVTLDIQWDPEIDISDLSVEYGGADAKALNAIIEPVKGEDDEFVDDTRIESSTITEENHG